MRKDVVSVFEKEPPKTGSLVQPILADVSVESDVERMIGECQSRFGQVDILINNAGLGGVVGSLTEISLKDWRDTFAVLVEGVLSRMKHAGRAMISQGTGGSIVNMASVAGLNGGIGPLGYSSAKAAVISMTQNAAVELAANRIRVNAICPGAIFTPMFSGDGAAKVSGHSRASLPAARLSGSLRRSMTKEHRFDERGETVCGAPHAGGVAGDRVAL